MSKRNVYAELEIRIYKREDQGYPVELTTKTDRGEQEFRGYLSPNILDEWTFNPAEPIASGQALFDHLLADQAIRDGWQRAWGSNEQRRIRLRIDETAPALHPVPWEVLHYAEPGKIALPLAANAATPFSRYLADTGSPGAPLTDQPLKLLVAIANPNNLKDYNLAEIDAELEKEIIQTALEKISPNELKVEFLRDKVTLKAIGDALREDYHMLHLVAHGKFSQNKQIASLCLTDGDNEVRWTKTGEFVEMLEGLAQKPRFIFLASCESATLSRVDAFRGFAPALVREAGIPAVLAMQELVPMATAQEFARVFYRQLLGHGLVDLAANEARAAIRTAGLPGSGIPVLFSRLPDNQLFVSADDSEKATEVPFMVEELPPDFVSRPTELTKLKSLLLDDGNVPQPVTVGMHGFGGYGKTILARAVCHELRDTYRDGVLWVTLGQNPGDLTRHIEDLIYGLTGERPGFASPDLATTRLTKALGRRQMLIVIDDVWNEAHLRPFLQGGSNCARIITTRDISTLPANVIGVDVGAMQTDEAVAILGFGLAADDTAPLEAMAARLGEWPLLLKLVNGTLRERVNILKQALPDALAYVAKRLEARGLTYFDKSKAEERDQAVTMTINASLELLSEEERDRYKELAVFPEDIDIPLSVLTTLWEATGGLDKDDVGDICARLFRLSLLLGYDISQETIRLHDVLRGYLVTQLNGKAPALHTELVNAWGDLRQKTNPYGQPTDSYALRWASYHLAEGAKKSAQPQRHELTKRLVTLLADSNFLDTYLARLNDLPAIQRDLELALECAADDDHPEAIALVVAASLALVQFRQEHLRPEPLFSLAQEGELETAWRRVDLFDVDDDWRQVALLSLAWLTADKQPKAAHDLHARLRTELVDADQAHLLWARIDADLNEVPMPTLKPIEAEPREELVRAIVNRMGGTDVDVELLARHNFIAGPATPEMQSHTGYLAEQDGPKLVAFAVAQPEKGTDYLNDYILAHTSYAYAYYRRQSLWILLDFLLRHPDQAWVRDMLSKLVISALAGSRLDFREGLPLTIRALQVQAGVMSARSDLDRRYEALKLRAEALAQTVSAEEYASNSASLMHGRVESLETGDAWGRYKRLMGALAENFMQLSIQNGDDIKAAMLLDLALELPHGFAGFQAPACLTLAESLHVCRNDLGSVEKARKDAQVAAHNIQDSTFCARMTARVNAMRAYWWPDRENLLAKLSALDLREAAWSLRMNPTAPEFSALHEIGHIYEGRSGQEVLPDGPGIVGPPVSLPLLDELLNAHTLVQLADAYQRPLSEFLRVNKDKSWFADEFLPDGTPVRVPDPGFLTYLAARLAAAALTDPALTAEGERVRIIQSLVPVAGPNPTALDTVLSRLLLAGAERITPELLTILAAIAPYSEEEPDQVLAGELMAIHELTTFVP